MADVSGHKPVSFNFVRWRLFKKSQVQLVLIKNTAGGGNSSVAAAGRHALSSPICVQRTATVPVSAEGAVITFAVAAALLEDALPLANSMAKGLDRFCAFLGTSGQGTISH